MKSGILIIDKPQGITSHDVVGIVRKTLKTKKVGHTGTLDPLATGVLIVCVEKATKLVNYLICDNKTYEAEMILGIKTDTSDITGKVIRKVEETSVDLCRAKEVINSFVGKQKQVPPMYSALKVNGQKLYELARKGIEIEREARDIEIYEISNIEIGSQKIELKNDNDSDANYSGEYINIKFKVSCSKGTYIRTLCEDIAEKLGTCGTMINLRRVQTGEFKIEDSIKIENITEENIISMEKLFDKKVDVKNKLKEVLNGMSVCVDLPDGLYKLYADEFIGIGKIENKKLKREIIL